MKKLTIILAIVALVSGACGLGDSVVGDPSALDLAERRDELTSLAEEIDQRWLSEKEIASGTQDDGFLVPIECESTLSEAQDRERVLDDAMFLALLKEDGADREVYDLLGKKIELLKELDEDLEQGCK